MRVRAITTTILLAAVLGAGATACSSSHPVPPTSPTTPAAPTTAASTSDGADAAAQCVEALEAHPGGAMPSACASLSQSAYFDAVQAANKAARDRLRSAIASAAAKP